MNRSGLHFSKIVSIGFQITLAPFLRFNPFYLEATNFKDKYSRVTKNYFKKQENAEVDTKSHEIQNIDSSLYNA